MNTLEQYISNAVHYTNPDKSLGGAERQRKDFLSYCEKHGLAGEFSKLVESDEKWQQLADKNQVFFFEDFVKNPYGKFIKPEIRLICTEMGTIPVIKLLRERD